MNLILNVVVVLQILAALVMIGDIVVATARSLGEAMAAAAAEDPGRSAPDAPSAGQRIAPSLGTSRSAIS